MTSQTRIAITGNTFPVKDQIKALGGRWNPDAKAWMVPVDKADQAKALVTGAPRQSSFRAERVGAGVPARRTSCRGCRGPIRNAPHHRAMGGYCGSCAFDEFDN